jgi:hypothetical protein
MRKLYSIKGEDWETCFPKDYFVERLKDDDYRNSYRLEEWKPEFGTEQFWCQEHGEAFESSKGVCGSFDCPQYEPRNGKSGRCRWHSNVFNKTGKTIVIEK